MFNKYSAAEKCVREILLDSIIFGNKFNKKGTNLKIHTYKMPITRFKLTSVHSNSSKLFFTKNLIQFFQCSKSLQILRNSIFLYFNMPYV